MFEPKVTIDAGNAIRAYARLKQVNVYTVVYNAMKDFVGEAYRVTPVGRMGKNDSPFALLTPNRLAKVEKQGRKKVKVAQQLRGGKTSQCVPIRGTAAQQEHLRRFQVKVAQKWSMTSWIMAMRMLGMGKASGGVRSFTRWHQRNETVTGENIVKDKTERKASDIETITLTDHIYFEKRPGAAQAIISAGTAKAAGNISRNWYKEVAKRWGAQ